MRSVCTRPITPGKWRATIPACLCTILIACGGGSGGGSGGGNPSVPAPPAPPAPPPAAPTAQFTAPAQATDISLGQSVSLAWNSTAATGCVASESSAAAGSFQDSSATATRSASGSATVTPTASGTFTYTIACTGGGGTASATTTVTVLPPPPATPAVTVMMAAQNMNIALGDGIAITWQSTNATSCTSTGPVGNFGGTFDITFGGSVPSSNTTSGSLSVTPLGTGNFTYTISCSGPDGTGSASTSITVAAKPGAPPITITSPKPGTSIVLGQSVSIAWQAPTAELCFAITGPGSESGFGTNSATVSDTPGAVGIVTYGVTCSDTTGKLLSFAAAPPVTVTADFVALANIVTIGSSADPILHDSRPTNLMLAARTAGPITAGDLLTCNFSDADGKAGSGTTLVGLSPSPGAKPYRIAQSTQLEGCNQLATVADGTLFAAAYTANQTSMITPAGVVSAALPPGIVGQPTGIAFAPDNTLYIAAIDVSRPDGGSIYRVTLNGDTPNAASAVKILSGLCTSGSPGALRGPVSLMYDRAADVLYIADTSSGSLIFIGRVSTFSDQRQLVPTCNGPPPTGLEKDETAPNEDAINFSRIEANISWTPVGMARLANGNLLVINGDLPLSPGFKGPPANSLIECSPGGVIVARRQLDAGPAGALSGIAASTDSQGNPIVYFADGNTNAVMMLK